MIKGPVNQENITVPNIHELKLDTFSFIKSIPIDYKTHINPNSIIVNDFVTPDQPSRHKIKRDAGIK